MAVAMQVNADICNDGHGGESIFLAAGRYFAKYLNLLSFILLYQLIILN